MTKFQTGWLLAEIIVILCLIPFISPGQNKSLTCLDLKNGIFHSYPKNSTDHYLSRRDGAFQQETNTNTGDSVLWEIKWTGDCRYILKYISGKMSEAMIAFVKRHELLYDIVSIGNNYYVFKGYVDKISDSPFQSDTMWLNEKASYSNTELFKQIPDHLLKKTHFSDTSGYALLYVYRPGKITNSLGNYIIYFDDNFLCVAKNKSGYIFKIFKEGKFEIKSKLYKDESAIKLDVKFGNRYYIKSMIHWGIYRRLYNFKLEMAIPNPQDGKTEFENVNIINE